MFARFFRIFVLFTFFVVGFNATRCSAQYTNGIFAEFNTSMGNYTCVLYYAYAPKAVANFIGLATGKRAWLDLTSGVVKTNPFYNGLTFHRVITNFVIQAGSPNGLGTDGPGYAFVDEITNALQFDRYGVLAMANSGPDSNGSQFFVLATNNWPSLNNGYTVFGRLYGGSNVVHAINRVATDANNKPLSNVYINSIKIVTNGSAATAFNINAQGLPLVTNLDLTIAVAGTNVALTFSNRLYADNRIYSSSNLVGWTPNLLGIDNSQPITNTIFWNGSAPALFFRGARIQYASSTGPPKTWFGKTLTVFLTNGVVGTNVMQFDSTGGGTYIYNGSPGMILGYNWYQAPLPFNGSLVPIGYSGLSDTVLSLHWKNGTSGFFSGAVYPFGYPVPFNVVQISGTFTNSP
jgi:peptidyl-prolyl cis-trans isomerase A (cyclophilin A)